MDFLPRGPTGIELMYPWAERMYLKDDWRPPITLDLE